MSSRAAQPVQHEGEDIVGLGPPTGAVMGRTDAVQRHHHGTGVHVVANGAVLHGGGHQVGDSLFQRPAALGEGTRAIGLRLGSLSKLAGSTGDLREGLLAGRELLPLLKARGLDLRRHRGGVLLLQAPTWLTAPVLAWLTAHVALARVSLTAHSDPSAEEPREVCRDTLAEARRLGISAPRLEAAEPYFAHAATGRA